MAVVRIRIMGPAWQVQDIARRVRQLEGFEVVRESADYARRGESGARRYLTIKAAIDDEVRRRA